MHLAHPTSSYPGTSAWVLNLNHKFDNWKNVLQFVSPQAFSAHRGRCVRRDMAAFTGKGIWAPPGSADVVPLEHHASITVTPKLACNIHIGLKFRQKTIQSSFAPQLFLTKQPGNISMAVALQILAPSGHGTQCWTALRLVMVFSVMFFTKTEPGSHFVHPMPSLWL